MNVLIRELNLLFEVIEVIEVIEIEQDQKIKQQESNKLLILLKSLVP